MEINYLREFVVLAQTGNFMEAADLLYCSQSTLSKHIQNMETELGVPLFDRTTRKVALSKFGQLLLPYAKQIAELQDTYTAILQSGLSTDQDILIGGPELAAHAFRAGLVDECQLFLTPILVGGGKPSLPDDVRLELELLEERRFSSGVVFLRYRTKH